MYEYVEYPDITPEQILQKVTQEQIFEFVFSKYGINVKVNFKDKYKSIFREDRHAGCFFGIREDNTILFQDFPEVKGRTHRSCFAFVMEAFNTDLSGAIRIISRHFRLSENSADYEPVSKIYTSQHKEQIVSTEIFYTKSEYQKRDKLYWSQFITTIDNLLEDNVFATNRVKIHSRKGTKSFPIYGLGYAIDFIDAVKIYQPYSKDYKWITNCNENHIGNFDNLPPTGDKLIIAKGYKDHRVFRNLNLDIDGVVWFMNEGAFPSDEILSSLVSRFKRIIIFYDNDNRGTLASRKLKTEFDMLKPDIAICKEIPFFYNQKDIGEYVNKEGRQDTIKLLKKIKLI